MTEESLHAENDGLSEVGRYASEAEAHEHALVILAMGRSCRVDEHHSLQVSPEHEAEVRSELLAYAEEQAAGIPEEPALPLQTHPAGWTLYFLWAASLILMFRLQAEWPALTDAASSSNLRILVDHQWWRPLTALFLHSDPPHLLGNLLGGLFMGTLVTKSIGPFRGWFWILACGTIGNFGTALATYPEPFSSIGASTAVFAALGILSGFGLALMLHHHARLPWLRILSPVIAGTVILAMIGSGTEDGRTDVLGHCLGFLAGIAAGYLNGIRPSGLRSGSNAGNATAAPGART